MRKKLAVMLLTIVQTARNPTPITATMLTRKVHSPDTLRPQTSRISRPAQSHSTELSARVDNSTVSEGRWTRGWIPSSRRRSVRLTARMTIAAPMRMTIVPDTASPETP